MQGLLQRRKPFTAPRREARSSFALPKPSDPGYPAALEAYKEWTSALAVAHGFPAVGSRMTNAHGIEWTVDGHTFFQSVATLGTDAEGDDPRLLYPVVVPQNFSERLVRMLEALHLCTPKEFVSLDTMPYLRPNLHVPYAHRIPLFLDN